MMLRIVTEYLEKYHMLCENELVLAAVSGGADSMCLLNVLRQLSKDLRFSVEAVHYNHHLRGEVSVSDAQFVEHYCREQGIPFHLGGGDVSAFAREKNYGIEEAARILRYEFFNDVAKRTGAQKIATAHTADDNAETVILNLARGAGLRGLSGIPPIRDNLIRPMLCVTRTEVEAFLRDNGIPHVEDLSNAEEVFARNRVRHKVIPVLKGINSSLLENITSMTELLREDEAYLGSLADAFLGNASASPDRVVIRDLLALPKSVASRVIRKLAGTELSSRHVSAIFELCQSDDPSAELDLPSLIVYREYNDLIFSQDTPIKEFEPISIEVGKTAAIPELNLSVTCTIEEKSEKIHKSFTTFLFKYDEVCGKIIARPRKTGDKICLAGRTGSKTLKKLFIEEHIPMRTRGLVPVLSDDNGVLAVLGIGMDARVAAAPGDQVLNVTFEEII